MIGAFRYQIGSNTVILCIFSHNIIPHKMPIFQKFVAKFVAKFHGITDLRKKRYSEAFHFSDEHKYPLLLRACCGPGNAEPQPDLRYDRTDRKHMNA